jgi:hypothetical protein
MRIRTGELNSISYMPLKGENLDKITMEHSNKFKINQKKLDFFYLACNNNISMSTEAMRSDQIL